MKKHDPQLWFYKTEIDRVDALIKYSIEQECPAIAKRLEQQKKMLLARVDYLLNEKVKAPRSNRATNGASVDFISFGDYDRVNRKRTSPSRRSGWNKNTSPRQ